MSPKVTIELDLDELNRLELSCSKGGRPRFSAWATEDLHEGWHVLRIADALRDAILDLRYLLETAKASGQPLPHEYMRRLWAYTDAYESFTKTVLSARRHSYW